MAAGDYIGRVRLLADIQGDEMFTDTELLEFLNGATSTTGVTSVNLAVADIWRAKAGKYASLADVTEAGSSRKLGDLYKHALEMAAAFQGKYDAELSVGVAARPMTRPIVRPI